MDSSTIRLEDEWLPVPGWPKYEVSRDGCVRRAVPGKATLVGRLPAPSMGTCGYLVVHLSGDVTSTGWQAMVHRLVTAAFVGPCPLGHECHHKNGNRLDNRLENLEYQLLRKHRSEAKQGSRNTTAKLREDDVQEIRRHLAQGVMGRSLARQYGVAESTISDIKHGRNWGWLPTAA